MAAVLRVKDEEGGREAEDAFNPFGLSFSHVLAYFSPGKLAQLMLLNLHTQLSLLPFCPPSTSSRDPTRTSLREAARRSPLSWRPSSSSGKETSCSNPVRSSDSRWTRCSEIRQRTRKGAEKEGEGGKACEGGVEHQTGPPEAQQRWAESRCAFEKTVRKLKELGLSSWIRRVDAS